MRLQDHIDFTTLQWVKPELEQTLSAARHALEAYVEDPGKRDLMRVCVDGLHQTQGTLRMVELYGAAMVAEEMETLAIALMEDHVSQRDEAYAALMRGLVQLPDYLERLSSGHRDVPVVLLPLLNDLRASRGQPALHDSVMFTPNLNAALPSTVAGAANADEAETRRAELADLRVRFQQQLLAWFRGQSVTRQLTGMQQTLQAISACCYSLAGRRLWWIAAAVLEGTDHGMLKSQAGEVRQLIGRVDRCLRQLIEGGEDSLYLSDADDLARKLLYLVAQATQFSPQMSLLRQVYSLDALVPDASELAHARSSMSGHNRALLDSVARALKDDLLRVKEALDLFLRDQHADPARLSQQADVLERVGDTLGMLALGLPKRVVNEQRRVLNDIASRQRTPDEETLLDVAGALLYVEASLDDHIETLGAEEDHTVTGNAHPLPRSEARSILAALMQEAVANTSKVKEAIVAFIESGWQHAELTQATQLMDEVAGALRMLSAPRPAQLAEGVGRFIGNELLGDRRVPGSLQMDQLADALAALEYYLEAAREHRGGLEHILDVAEHSLNALGYWPPPAARAPAAPTEEPVPDHQLGQHPPLSESVSLLPGNDASALFIGQSDFTAPAGHDLHGLRLAETGAAPPPPAETGDDDDWIEIEEEVFEQVPVQDALTAEAGFRLDAAGIDDDIREIFLEEVQEEIDHLQESVKLWLADVAQTSTLTPIRRSFHTLKGSGRLVGAGLLGEFAWKIENMLNRVLDESIQPTEQLQLLLVQAVDVLPQLLAALKNEGHPTAPLAAIMRAAEQLASGQLASVEQQVPAAMETVRRVVRRRVPRNLAAADAVPAASLAALESEPEEPAPAEVAESAYVGPAIPPVDPVLLEILRSEVAQYLQIIRAAVGHAKAELPIDDGLMRAVHTLHGVIAMVEIPQLAQMLSPLEGLLKRLRAAERPLPPQGVHLLGQAADVVDYVMAQFDTADPRLPEFQALTDQLIELRDTLPEAKIAHVVYEPQVDEADGEPVHAEHTHDDHAVSVPAVEELPAVEPLEAAHVDDEAVEAGLHRELADAAAGHDAIVAAGAHEHELEPEPELAATSAASKSSEEVQFDEELAAALDNFDIEARHSVTTHPVDAGTEGESFEALFAGLSDELAKPTTSEDATAEPAAHEEDSAEHVAHEQHHEPAAPESHVEVNEPHELEAHVVAHEAGETTVGPSTTAEPADEPVAEAESAPAVSSHVEPVELVEHAESAELVEHAEHAEHAEHTEHTEHTEHVEHAFAAEASTPAAEEVAEPVAAAESDLQFAHIDADLLEIFTEEAREILDHTESVLAAWRGEPGEASHIGSLLRDLHTLKGGARIAGLVPVGDLTHAMETMLEKPLEAGSVHTGEVIATLEAGFDQLHHLLQRVAQRRGIEYPQAMIDRCLAMSGQHAPGELLEAAPEPVAEPQPAVEAAATDFSHLDLPALLPEEAEESHTPQEQIRVRAELLDNLVNHAGEVAIYRSRLEQQVAGYRFNLVELEQTVSRLRSQLRMLEIETEAQIIARFQREHREAGMGVFDPLELDRYSQLQQYSRALAESVSDLVSIQTMLDDLTRQAETLLIQQSRVSSELQDGLLRTRMLPFDTMVPNLRRTLRQAALEQRKEAQLYVEGAHGEMDRNLLDRIKAPFEHMLRNAIAHGIESPDERRRAGKPTEGAVRIRVAREATEVVVRVADDGRGLDRDAIRARAIERKLLRPDARVSDDQLLRLIAQPGFSTADEVTQLAGRGVGLDVVANEIKQLGGVLAVESQPGQGTTFVMRLPFTLAVTQAILVRVGEATYAIPMTSVQGVARITPDELAARLAEDEPSFHYNGEAYGIHDLAELLGAVPGHFGEEVQLPLLLTRAGDLRAAIRIDAVLGSREIVVKSVGPQISSVPGILGATIMGDGSVLVILDLAPLVRHGITRREQRLAEGLSAVETPVLEEQRVRPLVMVVDDSITMRKVTGRVLERHEYDVNTAKDGIDAIEKLHDRVPDLMLLDIEMPRMDGYELAAHMKADPRLRGVPIIMITSRSGEKHRQRAFDLGVERYLGKPYQEADLLAQIEELLAQHAAERNHE